MKSKMVVLANKVMVTISRDANGLFHIISFNREDQSVVYTMWTYWTALKAIWGDGIYLARTEEEEDFTPTEN